MVKAPQQVAVFDSVGKEDLLFSNKGFGMFKKLTPWMSAYEIHWSMDLLKVVC